MRAWDAARIAAAAGARLAAGDAEARGPERVEIDSRAAGPGALFAGLRGTRADGGEFAGPALAAGAWGALVTPAHEQSARDGGAGVVLVADDPLAALQRLAREWRRGLGAQVIGITGSTGKTSTKDLLRALLEPARRTVASRANLNTEIGLPIELLSAPAGTEVLVLEMAMRGAGQIAELAAIAEPDVGVIVNVGPVHLERLGSLEAIAAAKAELLAGLRQGATAVVPADEPLLAPHLRADLETVTFGVGGDVALAEVDGERLEIAARGRSIELELGTPQPHMRLNLLAAVAAALAVGVEPQGRVEAQISALRGERIALADDVLVIDDCYNANPMSMRAALDDLALTASARGGRSVAVLGDMLELGPGERGYHEQAGAQVAAAGVDLLIAVGPLAAAMAEPYGGEARLAADASEAAALAAELVVPRDTVLVKGSRGVGLEVVAPALADRGARS